jgi:DNA polymerase-3 subunit gamma/tau
MAKSTPSSDDRQAATADSIASESPRDDRYVVVARRYRPRSFEQLIGQQHVGRALCNAIETGRVGHAYLFTGARGVGKTSTARIFAKALNDPGGPTSHPDGLSDIAQAIDSGEDVDVLEIDGASNRGIDEIRSLRAGVGVRPSRSRYKIYIIDEVHMLTGAAFNALLKTLEEPPAHVKFIFCTTDPEKIPITVLSRCQRFDFAPVAVDSIHGRLREIVDAEGIEAEEDALRLIARRAEGSMRDSQSLLEQVMSFSDGKLTTATVHTMLGTADDSRLHELAMAIAARDAGQVLALIELASIEGVAAGQLVEQLLGYFRDLLVVTVGCPAEMQRHAGESLHAELRSLGQQWGLQTVLAMIGMLDQSLVRIRHSLHGRVLLESTLIQITHLPDLQSVADIAAGLANGGVTPAATPAVRPREDTSNGTATAAAEQKKNAESLIRQVPSPLAPPAASPVNPPPAVTAPVAVASPPPKIEPAKPLAANRPLVAASVSVVPQSLLSSVTTPSPQVGNGSKPPLAAKSRVQLMREVEQNPYVQNCLEIFGAEIVKVDPPK